MNDLILKDLKVVVEQAVRPVRATLGRKRRMREELLAHLLAIFDEETAGCVDATTAVERAKRRFGDPRELTPQLQQAVPWRDRCLAVFEKMGCQPDEAAWHLAGKHLAVMVPFYMVWLPVWLLIHGNIQTVQPTEWHPLLVIALVLAIPLMALVNVFLSIPLAVMLHKYGSGWIAKRRGRILLGGLGALAVMIGLVLPQLTGVAVLFILMTRQEVKQWRYQMDWT